MLMITAYFTVCHRMGCVIPMCWLEKMIVGALRADVSSNLHMAVVGDARAITVMKLFLLKANRNRKSA